MCKRICRRLGRIVVIIIVIVVVIIIIISMKVLHREIKTNKTMERTQIKSRLSCLTVHIAIIMVQ